MAYIENTDDCMLYVGIEKKLTIHLANNIDTNVSLKIDTGFISNSGKDYYIIPTRQGILSVNILLNNKIIKSYKYKVKLIPDPTAIIDNASESSSYISPGAIQNSKGITLRLYNFEHKINYQILFFKMIRITPDGKKTEVNNIGPFFNELIRNQLKQSLPGDVVIFDEIKVRNDADCYERKLSNITYFVN